MEVQNDRRKDEVVNTHLSLTGTREWGIPTRTSAIHKPTNASTRGINRTKIMEEEIQDVATDTNVEVDEATNSNENGQEDAVALKEKLEAAEEAKRQITARAKKAEEELKALKAKTQNNNNQNDPQLSDELKLIARGLSDEEIEQAKVISKGKGIVLTEAIKDPLFQIFQQDLKEKVRKEKAKLGASSGSSEYENTEEPGLKSGSTRDEHLKAFKKLTGRK